MKENLLSEIKLTERKSALLEQNNKEEKEIFNAFRDTIPTPSVHYERSFDEKVKSHTKPIATLPNLPIISLKKGKSWQQTCLLEPKYEGQTHDFTPV